MFANGETMKKNQYLALVFVFVGILACSTQPLPTQDVSNMVNATLTAIAQSNSIVVIPQSSNTPISTQLQPAVVQNTPSTIPTATQQAVLQPTLPGQTDSAHDFIPATGVVTGTLTFPASAIPPMRVAFFSLDGGFPSYMDTALGQSSFSMELPAGKYYVVAYALPAEGFSGNLAGGYTRAIACGLTADCTDHSLIPVTITVNQTIIVDPADWYAPEGSFPPMPTP